VYLRGVDYVRYVLCESSLTLADEVVCWRTGFNFLAHGSQDLYPVYITKNKLLSSHAASVATIIGNCVSTTTL
jgi:hypothetical protein